MYSEKQAQLNSTGWVRFGHNIAYYKNDITYANYLENSEKSHLPKFLYFPVPTITHPLIPLHLIWHSHIARTQFTLPNVIPTRIPISRHTFKAFRCLYKFLLSRFHGANPMIFILVIPFSQSDKDKARLCQQRLLCKSVGGNNVYVLTVTAPESQEEEKPKVSTG